jgi:hypothetical protein
LVKSVGISIPHLWSHQHYHKISINNWIIMWWDNIENRGIWISEDVFEGLQTIISPGEVCSLPGWQCRLTAGAKYMIYSDWLVLRFAVLSCSVLYIDWLVLCCSVLCYVVLWCVALSSIGFCCVVCVALFCVHYYAACKLWQMRSIRCWMMLTWI